MQKLWYYFFLNKFEAKDQASKAMPSTNSYETRLTFNIDKWDPQISGTNNQMMQKGFLDLKISPMGLTYISSYNYHVIYFCSLLPKILFEMETLFNIYSDINIY